MAFDIDVIQARYNGTPASLYLNYYGGYTYLGPSGMVAIASDGTLTTARAGINGSSNSSYALNVNASSSLNGINVTGGVDAYTLNATKSGLLAGIYVTKTSTSSVDACVWGNLQVQRVVCRAIQIQASASMLRQATLLLTQDILPATFILPGAICPPA